MAADSNDKSIAIPHKDWDRFLEDIPYIESASNFGLGNCLKEAGEVLRHLAELREREANDESLKL